AGQSFRPSFLPDSAETEPTTEERFEAQAGDDGSVKSSIDYGLNVSTSKQDDKTGAAPPSSVRGGRSREDAEAEQLRQDVANLPPEASLEAYEAMPVEAFGEALLRGMGWREGRAIGRKDRAEVEVVEMKRRAPGLGLGRYYLKKATLVDVKTPTLCDIVLEGSHELVPDVAQSALETAVPSRPGASVLVVLGSQRGQPGRLLERRTGDGLAVVQVHADMRVRKVYLDQVAEYVGPDAS
ncbi:hypothetical protein H632_c2521p0, partial [Helicosporidium sp. ATCC 50920]